MYQLFIPGLSRGLIEPTNLLPRGVIITSNKNHKAPSVPRVSVLNQSLLGPRTEPSLLSNQLFAILFYAKGGRLFASLSRISSSRKQLWVGHVFFRFGASGLQELVEAEEFAAEGAAARPPLGLAGIERECGAGGGEFGIEIVEIVEGERFADQ